MYEISEFDRYIYHEGKNFESYRFLGAHVFDLGTRFTVWAPNAKSISVVGTFNEWDPNVHYMEKISIEGLWSLFIEGVNNHELYKFHIVAMSGESFYKADPFAFFSEVKPKTASVTYRLDDFEWTDSKWIDKREKWDFKKNPIAIYELNFSSWRRNEDESYYSYKQLAEELIPYVLDLGYTHIEIMPLLEHPFDGSWGYQVTGYYAITSRFGEPKEFMKFVDLCHQNGIGVIFDWVPSHFCKDSHGLSSFDGSNLYEYDDPVMRENIDWGTLNFNYKRNEVRNFLISNANFLFDYYHIDGLRVDAVAYMIYKNMATSRYDLFQSDEKNDDAISFLKELNTEVFKRHQGILMIAEESSAYPLVTAPVDAGGLGFNLKWNMGWMNDTLKYIEVDPLFRKGSHDKLTFSLVYAFSENFVLPLSHDEVAHGKKSLLDKMPGDYDMKFKGLKLLLSYMYFHPGKKLTFMGAEFGQFIEWNEWKALDWHLLKYESHSGIYKYLKALNNSYTNYKELHELDFDFSGFLWNDVDNKDESIIGFSRLDSDGNHLLAVFNFTPVYRKDYWIKIHKNIEYEIILSSEDKLFFGDNRDTGIILKPFNKDGVNYISYDIPPLSATLLKPVERSRSDD